MEYKVYLGGHYRGRTDDEEKIRRMEERAQWHGRSVSKKGYSVYIGRRR